MISRIILIIVFSSDNHSNHSSDKRRIMVEKNVKGQVVKPQYAKSALTGKIIGCAMEVHGL